MNQNLLEKIRSRQLDAIDQMLLSLEMLPTSDLDGKYSLLNMAHRGLTDSRIVKRWIELALEEKDTNLKQDMVGRLWTVDPNQIQDLSSYIRLLVSCFTLDRIKPFVFWSLVRLGATNLEVLDLLIQAYADQRDIEVQRQILWALMQYEPVPQKLIDFFVSLLSKVDADMKEAIVYRLLKMNALKPEALVGMLVPAEPIRVRSFVMQHLINRSMDQEGGVQDAIVKVLLADPEESCRLSAVTVLTSSSSTSASSLNALLEALKSDPSKNVRQATAFAFEHSMSVTATVVDVLVAGLESEKSVENALFFVRVLAPHVLRFESAQAGLLRMLKAAIQVELAVAVIGALAPLVGTHEKVMAEFIQAFEREKQDQVRSALLKALSSHVGSSNDGDAKLVRFYHEALKSLSPELKAWALQGLIGISMDESRCGDVAPAAAALLDNKIDLQIRLQAARKLSKIPVKTDDLVAALKRAADQSTGALKDICQEAVDKAQKASVAASGAAAAGSVDWNDWYRRIDVEKNVKGIFPDVFIHFEGNPDMGKKILRAALSPDLSDNLYQNQVTTSMMVDFLVSKRMVDDDISRFCVSAVLGAENSGNPDYYLSVLKCNPAFSGLKEAFFKILDKRANANPILMKELLFLIEKDFGLVREALLAKTSPEAALPYFKFLAANLAHAEVVAILDEAVKKPGLLGGENRSIVEEAFRALNRDLKAEQARMSAAPAQPGLLDE